MGKTLRILVVLALLVAACKPAAVSTTTTKPPPTTTTTIVGPGSSTTSSSTTSTTLTGGNLSADDSAAVEAARAAMGQPELSDGGQLAENGAFEQSDPGVNPFEGLTIYFFEDENGNLVFYIEGPAETVRGVTIEFDALGSNGAIVSEGGYVGDQLAGPAASWSEQPQSENGQIANASDNPPPPVGDSDTLGAFIPTPIKTLDEFAEISIWIYSGLVDGRFDYAHYRLFVEELLEMSDDFVVVAAFFSGLLTSEGISDAVLAWVTPDG